MNPKVPATVALAILLTACGRDAAHRDQEQYEVIQEGSASGVTSRIQGPGETLPPITGTNADTTTAFTIDPTTATGTAAPAGTMTMPAGSTPVYVPPPVSLPPSGTAPPPRREPERPAAQPQRPPERDLPEEAPPREEPPAENPPTGTIPPAEPREQPPTDTAPPTETAPPPTPSTDTAGRDQR